MARSQRHRSKRILAGGVTRDRAGAGQVDVALERPRNPEHGDYASNVALQLAKALGRKPREIAEELVAVTAQAESREAGVCEPLEIAGAGFHQYPPEAGVEDADRPARSSKRGADFGRAQAAKPEKVQVEFVSANPTGPLHVGHGRQAALGDALAALLESQGHEVTREFYYNDAGAQIQNLALSVQARARGIEPGAPGWPADGYAGEYIADIAKELSDDRRS